MTYILRNDPSTIHCIWIESEPSKVQAMERLYKAVPEAGELIGCSRRFDKPIRVSAAAVNEVRAVEAGK